MNSQKRVCVLQVTPEVPNPKHVELFHNKTDCDFFFVTHDSPHKDALQFCPNTTWTDTRNILAEKVPREYDYYAFVDYDYVLRSQTELNPLEQILQDLDEYNPAVLTYYPGKGMTTPFANNKEYFDKYEYSTIPFTHCGMKIIHKSLLDYFFPMVTRFGGGVEACHLFNILEIPFLRNVVCSHKMLYDNGVTDMEAPHNVDPFKSKLAMDKMWMWLYPYFNKRKTLRDSQIQKRFGDLIPPFIENYSTYSDSEHIKKFYVSLFLDKQDKLLPIKSDRNVEYYDVSKVEKFFDLKHEHFSGEQNKVLVVVGNGPSLREEYFDIVRELNLDTFGLNSAYRYFEKTNWYPKFYGCFDYALSESHKEEWSKMILDNDSPIEKFFFIERPSVEAKLPHTKCFFSDEVRNHPKFVERPHNQDGLGYPHFGTRDRKISCTGANAVRTGIELGYEKIILIGHDAKYVQSKELDEVSFVRGCRYVVDEDFQKNPNYFWDDYQKKGDLFHNPGSPVDAWHRLGECLEIFASDIDVVNCSEGSAIQCFRFSDFEKEVNR